MTTGDQTLVWDTDRATVRTFPQSGAQAVRPDGRVYVAADDVDGLSVYDLASEGDNPDRAHRVQRQRPVGAAARVLPRRLAAGRGAPLLGGALGHAGPVVAAAAGRLAQQRRRPDRRRRARRRPGARRLERHPAGGLERARRRQLRDAGGGPHRHRGPAPQRRRGRQHGARRLPELRRRRAGRHRHRHDDRHLQRGRPERPALDAAAGELDLEPVPRRRHGGQLRPRRPRLRLRHRRRAPDHRADRAATPRWSPTPSSTTPGCCSPPASTARCGCGTRAHRRPRSRATSPTTCAASSAVGSTPTAGSSPSRTTTSTCRARRPRRPRPHR